jgi:drug/metabolite transporter (DMT)-like permease
LLFAVESPEAAFLLVLATSVVYLVFGGRIADRAVSGIAVVGVVVGVVGALAAVGIDDTPSGTAVLVLGAVLLAGAVVAARQVDGRGRPAFGRPVLPLGPRWGMTVIAPETATAMPPAVPPPPPDEARGTD